MHRKISKRINTKLLRVAILGKKELDDGEDEETLQYFTLCSSISSEFLFFYLIFKFLKFKKFLMKYS